MTTRGLSLTKDDCPSSAGSCHKATRYCSEQADFFPIPGSVQVHVGQGVEQPGRSLCPWQGAGLEQGDLHIHFQSKPFYYSWAMLSLLFCTAIWSIQHQHTAGCKKKPRRKPCTYSLLQPDPLGTSFGVRVKQSLEVGVENAVVLEQGYCSWDQKERRRGGGARFKAQHTKFALGLLKLLLFHH